MSSDPANPILVADAATIDGSSWSAPHETHIPVHWHDNLPADRGDARLGDSFPVYAMGFVGTIVAGGLFPWAIIAVDFLASGRGVRISDAGELLVDLLGFSLIGALIAGFAAVCVFPVVGLIQWLGGLYPWRALLAAIAGGWSGIAATQALLRGALIDGDSVWEALPFQFGATVMGHIGAGFAAGKAHRWQLATSAWRDPPSRSRLALRQLLGITAGVAVLAAILGSLQLSHPALIGIGSCVAAQLVMTAGYYVIVAARTRRSDGGSAVALPPTPSDDSAVPRETTATNVEL